MKHTLRISLAKKRPGDGIVGCRHVTIREKILRFLFGGAEKLTVIVPGDSVKALSITEDGGEDHEQDQAAVGRGD